MVICNFCSDEKNDYLKMYRLLRPYTNKFEKCERCLYVLHDGYRKIVSYKNPFFLVTKIKNKFNIHTRHQLDGFIKTTKPDVKLINIFPTVQLEKWSIVISL